MNSMHLRQPLILLTLLAASLARAQTSIAPPRPQLGPGESNHVSKPALEAPFTTQSLAEGLTPSDLVQTLVGTGVTISDVNYTGASIASGVFAGGDGILGFDSGIVLGSGAIADIVGPNELDDTSTAHALPGDPELDLLIPGYETHDATVLEFDFECDSIQAISFAFVFASEEYNEWVNSPYNDVFGFFLNGQNIALIPATTIPASINNLNCNNPYAPPTGLHCGLFINNDCSDIGAGSFPCDQVATEMDGLTQVLFASASIPAGTNHIKLAIADAGDEVLDSNVFLKASSLQCGTYPDPVTYCTAGTTSTGCVPEIESLGSPSASSGAGFIVSAEFERNGKPGLLLYGVNGRAATPFHGGILCVAAPLRRTPIVWAEGNPPPADDCSGELEIDMNAFAAGALGGHPIPELTVAGTVVDCQWWARDPSGTVFSDALEYVIFP
jgi:hypothetical protein